MGVHRLWEILEPCKQQIPLDHLENKCVCVDLSYWVTQLHQVSKGSSSFRDKPHLRGLFHRIRAFLALNCRLIFVADGDIPGLKVAAYRKRMASGLGRSFVPEHEVVGPLRRNRGSEFSRMIEEAKGLAEAFGLQCITSLEEAEAQCAILDSAGFCDGCFTADSDAFLFGAQTVYKEISLGKSGQGSYVVAYNLRTIERELGLGRKSLIALGLMLGGDYFPGINGVGTEKALQIVRKAREDNILEDLVRHGLSDFIEQVKPKRKANKQEVLANKENLQGESYLSASSQNAMDTIVLQVIDAYLNPKCHPLNTALYERVLIHRRVDLHRLQIMCEKEFGWPTEKIYEYLLPKIAEGDVRHMAHLSGGDSPDSELQYRISEILKMRFKHGLEHFEVTWHGEPELKCSVLPASLVKRVYLKKVEEFMSKRAAKKEGKRRKARMGVHTPTNVEKHVIQDNCCKLSVSMNVCNTDYSTNEKGDYSSLADHVLQVEAAEISQGTDFVNTEYECEDSVIEIPETPVSNHSAWKMHSENVDQCMFPSSEKRHLLNSDSEEKSSFSTEGVSQIVDLTTPSTSCRITDAEDVVDGGHAFLSELQLVEHVAKLEAEDEAEKHERNAKELRAFLENLHINGVY